MLFGKIRSNALCVTKVDVSIKKISNKKTISVMDDMLKLALILFLLFNAIIHYGEEDLRIQLFSLPIEI